MKNRLFTSALALVALCSVASLSASETYAALPASPSEIPLQQVVALIQANGDTVTIGTSRVMVSLRIGSPNAVLADGSWLYSGYSARLSPSGPNVSGTLVVRFNKNVVTCLSLADKATVTALRQTPRRSDANPLLAVR